MNRSVAAMLRWSWLLGVSLLGPAALPAGGAERRLPQVRRHQGSGPLLSGDRCVLQASPSVAAPVTAPPGGGHASAVAAPLAQR